MSSQRAFHFPFGLAYRPAVCTGMAHIRLDDKEIELSVGELCIGADDDAGVRFGAVLEKGNLAIITVDSRGSATVRRAASGVTVLVNSVALGAEPAPLLHGDRIEVAGRQLRFSDDRKAGSTVLVPAFRVSAAKAAAPDRARAATGGRLVSLVDGREYGVPVSGIRIGRDAGCDVVVPGTDVSRHHAGVSVGPSGYVLRDFSANGVFVNGARIGDAQPLRRGDVIRVGAEEFRFYADEAPIEQERPAAAAMATFEVVNEGPSKGTRFPVRTPLVHVGRGPHNDFVIDDDSVSDSHAKLQRREAGWFVVDMDSTNGTYVAGHRVSGEHLLSDNVSVRFGGVKLEFRSHPASTGESSGGTRVIVGQKPPHPKRAPATRAIVAPRASQSAEPPASRAVPTAVWLAAAVLIGATVLFVLQDR
jgi:pSer/pThr/pTyr-binding forkhead associated (FHA) protein